MNVAVPLLVSPTIEDAWRRGDPSSLVPLPGGRSKAARSRHRQGKNRQFFPCRSATPEAALSGSGSLDRTSSDDLALLEAMRMGREVRLIVTGTIAGKGFRLGGSSDEELAFSCTVRVESVEAGEIA